jgi:two-component system CheB/CheR fusion protein
MENEKNAAEQVPVETETGTEHHETAQPGVDDVDDVENGIDVNGSNGMVFPVVGIGASAGGLAAFEAFFSGMPIDLDPGMAFVLVQHLAPNHKSILQELIQRYTRMQVFEVEDGMAVQPNCVYIIPPNSDMAYLNGTLQLLTPFAPHGQRLPIDFFFRSLAQDQGERAIGIVLSGTGGDGAQGVRAIKGAGGLVIAQSPESAEFDGMPRSALAANVVHYTLAPAAMVRHLIAYSHRAFGKDAPALAKPPLGVESAMKKICVLLRTQTGHDFSQYKPNTIQRRIERRMAVHQIEAIDDYVRYVQQTPAENEALFRDLLIGVTNFFRDPEVFDALEAQVIAKLFESKGAATTIQVWVAGCSTGEEAYSIAILLKERMDAIGKVHTVQLFATDIDSRAITTARAGLYPASIAADITPGRLARFFRVEPDGSTYRIEKSIRDMVVFSEQDVIKDPPFSKLDLLSCRNLLIYLGPELQKKLMPMFHYALKPGGTLLLGTSEGVGEFGDRFDVLDRKAKLYLRKEDCHGMQRMAMALFSPPMTAFHAAYLDSGSKPGAPVKLRLRELTEHALLQQLVPVGALVNAQGDILYLHGRAGMYLEPASGETGISNVLRMAREGLRAALTATLHQALVTRETVRRQRLSVRTNGHYTQVDLCVSPVTVGVGVTAESALFLVMLAQATDVAVAPAMLPPPDRTGEPDEPDSDANAALKAANGCITLLREELRGKDEYIQSTYEQLESTNEDLKSSNEEMRSINEELQSTNEELLTVNTELQTKVADLSRINNDMSNLLAGTGIGMVFVDYDLRIKRFTPAAGAITNLILSDVGRPVGDIASNLVGNVSLEDDAHGVLDTLVAKEQEVQTKKGKWYLMRIAPYRTLANVIEGAVISFVDIGEIISTREALQKANEQMRLAVVVRDARDAITVHDLDGRILAWNPGAVRMYGWSEAEALAMNIYDMMPQEGRADALAAVVRLSDAEVLEPYRMQRVTKNGVVAAVTVISTALMNEAGRMYAVATTERMIAK